MLFKVLVIIIIIVIIINNFVTIFVHVLAYVVLRCYSLEAVLRYMLLPYLKKRSICGSH